MKHIAKFSKAVLLTALFICFFSTAGKPGNQTKLKFEISFPFQTHPQNITGRVFVIIARDTLREPRFQTRRSHSSPFFGKDVENLMPGEATIIDNDVLGFPLKNLAEIPTGDYFVQGFINIYTKFNRADGHTIWLHNDQWEGQHWNRSPGNIYSDVIKIHMDPSADQTIRLNCNHVIPPVVIPKDTKWVKRIKFKSKILSDFWGQPIYIGATVLLPRDYDKNKKRYYPVNYLQGHFSLRAPKGFSTGDPGAKNKWGRRGYEFYKSWISDDVPRMIYVTFQHPCPYFDDSYAVNSANCGPYGNAVMKELIPKIESKFRIIRKPYARILEGGSTGGWEAAALQIFHADFFGGALIYCPDPVEFSDVEGVHVYQDRNAFYRKIGWRKTVIPDSRRFDGSLILTSRQIDRKSVV